MKALYLPLAILVSASVVACGGGGGGGGGAGSSGGGSISTPAPSISLSSSKSAVYTNESFTLTWSSSNATSCSASDSWSGSKATSGSEEITSSDAGDSTYTLSCSGSGGSSTFSTTVSVTKLIRIDQDDLTYRIPSPGDLYVADIEGTARSYSYGGSLSAEEGLSFSEDVEFFQSSLPAARAQEWRDAGLEPLFRQTSDSTGDISRTEKGYGSDSAFRILDNEGGEYVNTNADGETFAGSVFLLPLSVGSSYTEDYQIIGAGKRTDGTQTFTISAPEVIETPVGAIEAFKVSITDRSTEYSLAYSVYGTFERAFDSNTVEWVHPKIGVVMSTVNGKVDDTDLGTLFQNEYYEVEATYMLREVNYELPE